MQRRQESSTGSLSCVPKSARLTPTHTAYTQTHQTGNDSLPYLNRDESDGSHGMCGETMGTPSPQPESTPDNPIGSSAERSIPTSECLATPQPSRSHSLTVKPWAVQSLGMPAILASPFTKHATPTTCPPHPPFPPCMIKRKCTLSQLSATGSTTRSHESARDNVPDLSSGRDRKRNCGTSDSHASAVRLTVLPLFEDVEL